MFATITCHVRTASAGLMSALQAPSWEGRVGAVFHASLQLLGPEATSMHVHGGPFLVSPFSLRVDGPLAACVQEGRLAVGMAVRKRGARIEVEDRLRLALDLTRYYRSPDPPLRPPDPEGIALAWQILRGSGNAGGLALMRGGKEMLAGLQQALADRDARHVLAIGQQLVGLGPGLTPSGDDVLVGCLKGLWLCGVNARDPFATIVLLRQALLPTLSERTTAVAAAFIRYALHGQFAEVLDRAAAALSSPADPEAVASAMTRLLAQGETSGTDTALGLLLCLAALLNDRGGAKSALW